jgi:alkanesulfonate monooxygenase SsuD/methylene tetrahydromethanopterin reductase-like flavin-dependent oxidoreductase (luciferase family)
MDPNMPDEDVTVDYMMENIWIVGDPQECADRIRKLYEEVGGFGSLPAIIQDPEDPPMGTRVPGVVDERGGPSGRGLKVGGAPKARLLTSRRPT